MKYVWRIAFISLLLSPVAAKAEEQLRAFQNFDRKIQALENYSVYYWEGSENRKYIVMKSAPARQTQKDDGLNVELRPSKKKSS